MDISLKSLLHTDLTGCIDIGLFQVYFVKLDNIGRVPRNYQAVYDDCLSESPREKLSICAEIEI